MTALLHHLAKRLADLLASVVTLLVILAISSLFGAALAIFLLYAQSHGAPP